MKNNVYTIDDLLLDLNLDEESFEIVFDSIESKQDVNKVIELINQDNNLIPLFESDLQREEDFLEEENYKMKIYYNINGIILYKRIKEFENMEDKKLQKLIDYTNEFTCTQWTINELRNFSASSGIVEFYTGNEYDEKAIQNLLIELIRDYFDLDKMIYLISELNSYDGCFEEYYYYENGEDFFDTFYTGRIDEAIRACCYGNYRYMDAYVRINDYGNLTSISHSELENELFRNSVLEEITSYILENKRETGFEEIDGFIEILNEEYEEIEE